MLRLLSRLAARMLRLWEKRAIRSSPESVKSCFFCPLSESLRTVVCAVETAVRIKVPEFILLLPQRDAEELERLADANLRSELIFIALDSMIIQITSFTVLKNGIICLPFFRLMYSQNPRIDKSPFLVYAFINPFSMSLIKDCTQKTVYNSDLNVWTIYRPWLLSACLTIPVTRTVIGRNWKKLNPNYTRGQKNFQIH